MEKLKLYELVNPCHAIVEALAKKLEEILPLESGAAAKDSLN